MDKDQAILCGVPRKRRNCTIDNFKVHKGVTDIKTAKADAKLAVKERKHVLIKGDIRTGKTHLGLGILEAMLHTDDYLDVNGNVNYEVIRYIRANKFIDTLNNASFQDRKLMWDNLFVAYNDGSGWVKTIMIDDLGSEFGREAEDHIKLIVHRCDDENIHLIATTDLDKEELSDRYGKKVVWLLSSGKIIKLKGEPFEVDKN